MQNNTSKKFRITLIIALIAAITILHYATRENELIRHIVYRDLYFVPIMLSAFWFGLRGGFAASLSVAALYVPLVLVSDKYFPPLEFSNIMQVILFIIVGAILGVLHNREVRRQLELRKAERLAALGRAASAIAHDMKTPLVAIGGFVTQVQRKMPADESINKKLDIVLREVGRLENLVKDMLTFARTMDLEKGSCDLKTLLAETMEVARESADRRKVALQFESGQDPALAQIDHDRMKQVFINLIGNAIEASPEGGQVAIRLLPSPKAIQVEIADQGDGIPADQREKIFAPFFTTKKEGTGLGLAIAKKIIDAHDGRIDVLDNPGQGTIFRINLPVG